MHAFAYIHIYIYIYYICLCLGCMRVHLLLRLLRQEMMERSGVIHSACYEKDRKDNQEFLICIGRADCSQARTKDSSVMISAPHALELPEGKRK